jgi:hypothetical protein
MKPRFSAQHLRTIRNNVPIGKVMEECLQVPSKITRGILRFCCPLCREFDTAINPRTNLARCFSCEKNFNPIDMVMAVRNTGFTESVNFLEMFQRSSFDGKRHAVLGQHTRRLPQHNSPRSFRHGKDLLPIGDILAPLYKKNPNTPNKAESFPLTNTIAKLELEIQFLAQQIKQLKTIIHALQHK